MYETYVIIPCSLVESFVNKNFFDRVLFDTTWVTSNSVHFFQKEDIVQINEAVSSAQHPIFEYYRGTANMATEKFNSRLKIIWVRLNFR